MSTKKIQLYDKDNNKVFPALGERCYIYPSATNFTPRWFNFATITFNRSAGETGLVRFKIIYPYTVGNRFTGILTCYFGAGGGMTIENAELVWESRKITLVGPGNFLVGYDKTTNIINLYLKTWNVYETAIIEVLDVQERGPWDGDKGIKVVMHSDESSGLNDVPRGDNMVYSHSTFFYRVGDLYTSTSSENPGNLFGGTWECISADYDYINVGSQVIYPYFESSTSETRFLHGAYGTDMVGAETDNFGIAKPSNYTLKIGLSALVTSSGPNAIKIYLNSTCMIDTNGTWSGEDFRKRVTSNLYTLSQIGLQSHPNYSGGQSINLRISNDRSNPLKIYDLTMHRFLVSNYKIYKWRRTA